MESPSLRVSRSNGCVFRTLRGGRARWRWRVYWSALCRLSAATTTLEQLFRYPIGPIALLTIYAATAPAGPSSSPPLPPENRPSEIRIVQRRLQRFSGGNEKHGRNFERRRTLQTAAGRVGVWTALVIGNMTGSKTCIATNHKETHF